MVCILSEIGVCPFTDTVANRGARVILVYIPLLADDTEQFLLDVHWKFPCTLGEQLTRIPYITLFAFVLWNYLYILDTIPLSKSNLATSHVIFSAFVKMSLETSIYPLGGA